MSDHAVELVDVPPPLTLTYRLKNGNTVEVFFEPPGEAFFKTAAPGAVLSLTVREAREHVTRVRRTPPGAASKVAKKPARRKR